MLHVAKDRVERQLAAMLVFYKRVAEEAEGLRDQTVADELWEHYFALTRLSERLKRGKLPARNSNPTVRI